jgi:hypothetical protein
VGYNDSIVSKKGEKEGQSSKKPKRMLKEFYSAVLDTKNQDFLYQLVKQSITFKEDKKMENNSGATERTQMVTLALRTLQMFDF